MKRSNLRDKPIAIIMAMTEAKLNPQIKTKWSIVSSFNLYKENIRNYSFLSTKFYEDITRVYDTTLDIILVSEQNTSSFSLLDKTTEQNPKGPYVNIYRFTIEEFFSEGIPNATTILCDKRASRCIFIFEGVTYKEIVDRFALLNIFLSGGSNTKKHMLSPVQLRLARFIIAFSTVGGEEISVSFHSQDKEKETRIDWSDKKLLNGLAQLDTKSRKKFVLQNELFLEEHYKKHNKDENHPTKSKNMKVFSRTNLILSNKSLKLQSPVLPYLNIGQKREFSLKYNNEGSSSSIDLVNNNQTKRSLNNLLSNYLNSITEIINNSQSNPLLAQSKIENIWIDLIKTKLEDDKYLINAHPNKLHSLLVESFKTLNILETQKVISKKFPNINYPLNKIDYILLTYLWCTTYSNRLSYTALAKNIGDIIIYNLYKKSKMVKFKEFKETINYHEELVIKLGDFFISILTQYPHDLFEREHTKRSFYTHESVLLKINSLYLDEIRNNIVVNPYSLPMLSKPNYWSESDYGGYLENTWKEVPIITGGSGHNHKIENKDILYTAINNLNSIKFGINNLLLEYLYSEGSYLLDSVVADSVIQRDITLQIAKLFSKVPFYLNVHADWRGRIYTQTFFLSYQGDDLSSALLNFWDGEILTESGKDHFYIHGANNHNENNISKESFENRIQWVKDNYNKIINLDKNFILSAEKPFVFLSFCLNMRELARDSNTKIHIPVFLDATCSGIQHLSALILDLELGTSVNLTDYTQKDKPNDIYSKLLIYINKAINKYGQDNPGYEHFSLIKLTRSDIKQSVMTKVYNVSRYGIARQLDNKFKSEDFTGLNKASLELIDSLNKNKLNKNNQKKWTYIWKAPGKDNKAVLLSRKDINIIANILDNEIFVVYPSLYNIYLYFIDIAKLMINLGLPINWITPSGVEITQHYLKSKQSVISTKLFNKTKKMVIKEYLTEMDKLKQSNAIIPNIIHSLDATHLMNVINNNATQNNFPVITIHDCFGTHPNNMEKIVYLVKKEFIILYAQDNFLQTFHHRVLQSIKDNNYSIIKNQKNYRDYVQLNKNCLLIPEIPQMGELDLNNLIKSKYMLS